MSSAAISHKSAAASNQGATVPPKKDLNSAFSAVKGKLAPLSVSSALPPSFQALSAAGKAGLGVVRVIAQKASNSSSPTPPVSSPTSGTAFSAAARVRSVPPHSASPSPLGSGNTSASSTPASQMRMQTPFRAGQAHSSPASPYSSLQRAHTQARALVSSASTGRLRGRSGRGGLAAKVSYNQRVDRSAQTPSPYAAGSGRGTPLKTPTAKKVFPPAQAASLQPSPLAWPSTAVAAPSLYILSEAPAPARHVPVVAPTVVVAEPSDLAFMPQKPLGKDYRIIRKTIDLVFYDFTISEDDKTDLARYFYKNCPQAHQTHLSVLRLINETLEGVEKKFPNCALGFEVNSEHGIRITAIIDGKKEYFNLVT